MKKLRLVTKSLLFLSFFLPFIVLPECSESGVVARARQIKDSLIKDSIMQDSLMKVSLAKAGLLQHYYDSMNKEKALEVAKIHNNDSINNHRESTITFISFDSNVDNQDRSSYLGNLCSTLFFPSERSVSGLGASIFFLYIPIEACGSLGLGKVFSISILFSFLLTFGTIIYLFFKPNLNRQFRLSIGNFIFISLYGMLAWKYLLWGFYIALLLNILDIIVIYLSIRKEELIKNV